MYSRGGRQFSRGGLDGHIEPQRRRRFRGQYVRRRTPDNDYGADQVHSVSGGGGGGGGGGGSSSRDGGGGGGGDSRDDHRRDDRRGYHQAKSSYQDNNRTSYSDSDAEIKHIISRLNSELDQVKSRVRELETTGNANHLTRMFQDNKTDIDEIRYLFSKLRTDVDQVISKLGGVADSTKSNQQQQQQTTGGDETTEKDKRNKSRFLKQRERKAAKLAEKRAARTSESAAPLNDRQKKILNSDNTGLSNSDKPEESNNHEEGTTKAPNMKHNRRTNRERNTDKRRPKREPRGKGPAKPLPNQNSINDDSTTQAAEPSSEDRAEGEDGREGTGKERVKVLRRKKPHFGRRLYGNNRRRRADSSERNSNDTSPQGETNGHEDYRGKRRNQRDRRDRVFPELSESEMNELVQTWKREFLTSDRPVNALKKEMNAKGPKVVCEFAVSILDHAICDVTSPTKLSEIATSLYQLLVSEDNMSEVDFQKGFYDALKDISKREDDIAIDAPRYMDTLGQLLADCVIPMFGKHKNVVRKFLNRCIEAYCPQNKAVLLASIMKATASIKSDRFAKEIWDLAHLNWDGLLNEGVDLKEFLESQEVGFTTRTFTPEPKARKRTPEELEKFADDVTSAVESRCTPQAIDDLVKEFEIEAEEAINCYGTLIYAIVRGCLITDSGEYKLNTEALNKYSGILTTQHEEQVAIALHALTALTKLWHQYNCPQDLLRTILMELHNLGTAPFESLKTWLNSASMNNIPGIGAARLNSKRYIEDLEANLKP